MRRGERGNSPRGFKDLPPPQEGEKDIRATKDNSRDHPHPLGGKENSDQ